MADFLKCRNHSLRLSKCHNQVRSILYKPSLSFEVRLDMLFFLSDRAMCPPELYWSLRNAPFLHSGPRSVLLWVFSSSPVAPFSFLSKIDMGSPCCSAAVTINECVFPAPPPSPMQGAEQNVKWFLSEHAYFFQKAKMLFCTYLVPSSPEKEFIIRSATPSHTE